MIYLGIDLGGKRTGLAVGDDQTCVATPLRVLQSRDREGLLRQIGGQAAEHGAQALVVGLPLNMDGTAGPAAAEARGFAQTLGQRLGLPVHLVDERLSSFQAEEQLSGRGLTRGQKKSRRDALAAAAILNAFWCEPRQP
jgi:putative Holliday junction resolvase